MKRIEIIKNFRSGGTGYFAGEIRHVTPEQAGHFCSSGWAKDLSGEIPTGKPDTSPKKLQVSDGVHAAESDAAA